MRGKKAKAIRREFNYIVSNLSNPPKTFAETKVHHKEFNGVSMRLSTILNPFKNMYRKRKSIYS